MMTRLTLLSVVVLSLWQRSTAGEFVFRHHYIERDLPGDSYGQSSLVDIDRDGDLDFITGGKGPDKSVYWFEFHAPDRWTRHVLGVQHPSDVGGAAFDVDGDGWPDHVTGGVWYRNTGRPREERFERIVFDAELASVHDLVVADLDGDGRLDIVTMSDKNNLRWYRIPADPRQPWERHDIGGGVHAGLAVGDIDGDGDLDIARSNVWFENADGKALRWIEHPIPFGKNQPPYPLATRCVIADIDGDGRRDLVMTENEIRAGRIAWLRNADGRGRDWQVHDLPAGDSAPRGAYHSLAVADFDADGDLDIFTVEMEWIAGARPPRWYIWENADGKGARFVERVILDAALGGHEAVVADVDGDGDLDICSKLWRPRRDNANGGRNHADFLENRRIVLTAGQRGAAADSPSRLRIIIETDAGDFDIERDARSGHGPLGALYPTNTTHPQKEGDTMTFLYLLPVGLGDPDQPAWGSWGGRYGRQDSARGRNYYWANARDTWQGATSRDATLARWAEALQNDFKARLPRVVCRFWKYH